MFHFPAFPPTHYEFTRRRPDITLARFPHSDILGSTLACQLPEAYRRLQRPSSALHTKASTERPKTPTKTNKKNHNKPQFIATHTTNHKRSATCAQDARIHYTIPKHHTNTPHTNTKQAFIYRGGQGIEPKSLTACRARPKHPTTHTHNICMSDAG